MCCILYLIEGRCYASSFHAFPFPISLIIRIYLNHRFTLSSPQFLPRIRKRATISFASSLLAIIDPLTGPISPHFSNPVVFEHASSFCSAPFRRIFPYTTTSMIVQEPPSCGAAATIATWSPLRAPSTTSPLDARQRPLQRRQCCLIPRTCRNRGRR